MKHKKVLLASLLAASGLVGQSAYAAINWSGTADYTASPSAENDEGAVVGPFDTYDLSPGVVLLKNTGGTNYSGVYQSYVTNHVSGTSVVLAPELNDKYELTMVANFTQTVNNVSPTSAEIMVTGGTFNLYFDSNINTKYDFAADTGFTDGDLILTGTILSGEGSALLSGSGMIFGVTDITVKVDSYNTSVFEPDTIAAAGGIFTLRLGSSFDAPLLNGVTSVNNNSVDAGDLLFAADGNIALAVPEAETYAMMLAGLGLVGFMARRRTRMFV